MPAHPLCPAHPSLLSERNEDRTPIYERQTNPDWSMVEAAIRRLDNGMHTDVSLEFGDGPDRTAIIFGGGRDDRVTCCVARADDPAWGQDFRFAIDGTWRSGVFEQVVGGQQSDLAAELSITREQALKAARYFFSFRALHPDLEWKVP